MKSQDQSPPSKLADELLGETVRKAKRVQPGLLKLANKLLGGVLQTANMYDPPRSSGAIPQEMKSASHWRLLFANPLILVPFVISTITTSILYALSTHEMSASSFIRLENASIHRNYFGDFANCFISQITGLLTFIYAAGISLLIYTKQSVTFSDANRIFLNSMHNIKKNTFSGSLFLLAWVAWISSASVTFSSFHHTGNLYLKLFYWIISMTTFISYFFSAYWSAAIVVGKQDLMKGFLVSAQFAFQRFGRTSSIFLVVIAYATIPTLVFLFFLFSHSSYPLFLIEFVFSLLVLPTMAYFSIATVGEYSTPSIRKAPLTVKKILIRICKIILYGVCLFVFVMVIIVLALFKSAYHGTSIPQHVHGENTRSEAIFN